jgi:amino acid adenylation domain-containing protein
MPLSFAQRQLWFLDRLAENDKTKGGGEYLDPIALQVRGPLNVAALRGAFDALADRHSVLRTRYTVIDGEPYQTVGGKHGVDFGYRDLNAIPDETRRRTAVELVERESARPFDLTRDHPLRVLLVRLSSDEHLVLIVLHHIASDAWSRSIVARELGELYAERRHARPAELAPLAMRYADFAMWQRQRLSGPVQERLLSFWRDRLSGLAPVELPTDGPRAARRDATGAVVPFAVPAPLFRRLTELGRRRRATPFMTFLAGYFALLARYCGQEDLAVGTPTAGRDRLELEDLIGCFANMLVMRSDLAGDPSFEELQDRVRDMVLSAFAHREMPFEKLVGDLGFDRDLAVNPLFQIAFAWQNTPQARFALPGLHVEPLGLARTTAKFDLTLRLTKGSDGGLAGEFEYASALFDEATITRFARHYVRVLECAADRPGSAMSRLDLLTPAERTALRAGSRAVAGPGAGAADRNGQTPRTLPALFERQAARTPDAVAITHEGAELTYRELDRRADRLARSLRAEGVGAETLVAIYAEPGIDLIVGLIAIVKAGGAYLPIDPESPASRTAAVLTDAGPAVILGAGHLLRRLNHPAPMVALDRREPDDTLDEPVDERVGEVAGPDDAGHVSPEHLAYVIYTSGSTGLPKGVMVTHANVVRLFAAARPHTPFGAGDVWTFFHSAAFDFSVWEIWGALVHGGRLVVVPPGVARSPEAFARLLVEQRVSVLSQTPSAFRGLLETVIAGNVRLDDLRLVVFGGEALDGNGLAPWFDRYGDRGPAMVNMYGITETTVHVTYRHLSKADLGRPRSVIGRPLDDLRIMLLDAAMNPVPDGMPGEIYVAGPGLARGYLNRPSLTAQRFVPDPFGDQPGARLYRSGDRARRLPDGDLEYLGRIDDQVKIRGFRIELGEIEAALNTHPAVSQSAVARHEASPGTHRLVAYLVPATASAPTATEMRAHLAERLPGYMIPALYLSLSALPRTAGGKLDRRALPAPHPARVETGSAQGYVAPRSPRQVAIARTWSTVLDLERVGVEDNFFELGGDSIRAVQLVGALRHQGWPVTVEMLFQHRTVGGLCAALDVHAQREATAVDNPGIAPFALLSASDRARLPSDAQDAYPLSLMQTGMLFELASSPEMHPYHNVVSYPVRNTGDFSAAGLRKALDIVAERNEILRTSFELVRFEESLQLIHRAVTVPLTVGDLSGLDAARAHDIVTDLRRAESERLFDLGDPPLLRVHAHVLTGDRWLLTLTESHTILDGWSHHSLVNELLHVYRDIRDGVAPEDAGRVATRVPPAARFADFVALERQALHDEESRTFWRHRATDFDRIDDLDQGRRGRTDPDVPGEDRGGRDGHDGRFLRERVPLADLEASLRALANEEGLPVKTVLLTAHLAALATFAGKDRFMTGLVVNGRPEVRDGDQVLGMFLNTVPFGVNVAGTWRHLLHTVYEEELAVWPHRRYPLPAMQREWGGQDRLLNVLFNYIDFYVLDQDMVDVGGIVKLLPMEFTLQVIAEPGTIVLSGRTDLMAPDNIRRLAADHRRALEALAARRYDDGPLLPGPGQ